MTTPAAAPRVRTLVVDDEPLARAGVRALLEEDAEVEVVAECANGRDAVAAIRRHAPDLVLLDVQMPQVDGFAVVREIGAAAMPVTVFVTAFDQYALKAFEARALDYLLKPFTDERFREVVERAKAHVRQRRVGQLGAQLAALLAGHAPPPVDSPPAIPAAEPPPRFMVRLGSRTSFVRVEDVDWVEASDYYAQLHVAGATHLVRETMQEIERRLDPRRFVRVHRSAIVNVARVREIRVATGGRQEVVLRDGTRIPVSRGRREQLERACGELP
jgi:two-component system LytT family response regulator